MVRDLGRRPSPREARDHFSTPARMKTQEPGCRSTDGAAGPWTKDRRRGMAGCAGAEAHLAERAACPTSPGTSARHRRQKSPDGLGNRHLPSGTTPVRSSRKAHPQGLTAGGCADDRGRLAFANGRLVDSWFHRRSSTLSWYHRSPGVGKSAAARRSGRTRRICPRPPRRQPRGTCSRGPRGDALLNDQALGADQARLAASFQRRR